MKLYVLATGSNCNAHCKFCITKYRNLPNDLLDISKLKKVLRENQFEKIEITGGGEPGLHPKINEIVEICSSYAPTQIYTNGTYKPQGATKNLIAICISRAHHDQQENRRIMGVDSDLAYYKRLGLPIKLSLILHQSGVHTEPEIINYLDWAKDFASKVVIRQLFEYQGGRYRKMYQKEFLASQEFLQGYRCFRLGNGNREIDYKGLLVEVEERTCACENENPVLYANGKLMEGWEE
jgi:MoaA/NifB/PqqE/SkfB family radical SAM enzyme